MSIPIYAHIQYYGPIGVNITTLAASLVIIGITILLKNRHKQAPLLEWALLVLLLSFVFQTLHGSIIQHVFPIALPERPLYDNNLTFNYILTNGLAYIIVPILTILAINRHLTIDDFGFKIIRWKHKSHTVEQG